MLGDIRYHHQYFEEEIHITCSFYVYMSNKFAIWGSALWEGCRMTSPRDKVIGQPLRYLRRLGQEEGHEVVIKNGSVWWVCVLTGQLKQGSDGLLPPRGILGNAVYLQSPQQEDELAHRERHCRHQVTRSHHVELNWGQKQKALSLISSYVNNEHWVCSCYRKYWKIPSDHLFIY